MTGFYQNAEHPKGLGGKIFINMMNKGHAKLSDWGFTHLTLKKSDNVLDVGCGGGRNLSKLLKICINGTAAGIDLSEVSVKQSTKFNKKEVDDGRCRIHYGNVSKLPFEDNSFEAATAFETVYFWQNLASSFIEIFRVIKPGGVFMICNESDGLNEADIKWTEKINGMTIYNKEQLTELLDKAGFVNITADNDLEKHWLCITAEKPVISE
ncbi:MAG TPA: class I SAM-dependent methyltransferase [Methanocorpusculum sp.]|nr:class I SAM-dependent methyltransferase [Methanocorpusculum sp.]